MSIETKHKFNWETLDASIGHKGSRTKSLSYKYINEVVVGRFKTELPEERKERAKINIKVELGKSGSQLISNEPRESQTSLA